MIFLPNYTWAENNEDDSSSDLKSSSCISEYGVLKRQSKKYYFCCHEVESSGITIAKIESRRLVVRWLSMMFPMMSLFGNQFSQYFARSCFYALLRCCILVGAFCNKECLTLAVEFFRFTTDIALDVCFFKENSRLRFEC